MTAPLTTPTYSLDGWVGNATDDAGVDWIVETEDGWSSTPGVRLSLEDLPNQDGAYDGPSYRGPRTITLSGQAYAPTRAAMLAAKDRLAGLCDDQGADALLPLVVAEEHLTRQAMVRLAADTKMADQGSRLFTWSLALIAPDPLRYDVIEHNDTVGLPTDAPGWTYPRTYPRTYPAASGGSLGEVYLTNAGTATTWPIFDIRGPVDTPVLINGDTGAQLGFDLVLAAGDVLEVDAAAGTVVLNGTASRRYTLLAGSEWWGLSKGVNRVLYRAAAYSAESVVSVRWRSAWR